MRIETKALPERVKDLLRSLGYGRRDIELTAATETSVQDMGGDGCRGFFAWVNLETGERHVSHGSWGGPNMFNPRNQVDMDPGKYQIPPNVIVARGWTGGKAFASLYCHPASLAPMLPAAPDASERDKAILAIFRGIKSGPYRAEYLARANVQGAEIDALVSRGLLSRNAAGSVQITTDGKNACGSARVS